MIPLHADNPGILHAVPPGRGPGILHDTTPHRNPGILHIPPPCRDPAGGHSADVTLTLRQSRTRGSHSTDVFPDPWVTEGYWITVWPPFLKLLPLTQNSLTQWHILLKSVIFILCSMTVWGSTSYCKESMKTNKESSLWLYLQDRIWLLLTDIPFVPKLKNKVSIFTLQNIFPCDHKFSTSLGRNPFLGTWWWITAFISPDLKDFAVTKMFNWFLIVFIHPSGVPQGRCLYPRPALQIPGLHIYVHRLGLCEPLLSWKQSGMPWQNSTTANLCCWE